MKEVVRLGFPGDSIDAKMGNTSFSLERGERAAENPDQSYPQIIKEAEQVFECIWDSQGAISCQGDGTVYQAPFNVNNGVTSEHGAIFILKIDKILMKSRLKKALLEGNGKMPSLPVDYGFRDNSKFWISRSRRPLKFPILKDKGVGAEVVQNAAEKMDPSYTWDDGCYDDLKLIPRIFLNTVLRGVFSEAENRGTKQITREMLAEIRDKRTKDKKYH